MTGTVDPEVVGTVAELWRFPVKSMQGSRVDALDLTERGAAGDRGWGVVDPAAGKVLSLQMSGPVAVAMGILTGIGGGLIRDVLAGRPTLLMSREIYATPILIGCTIFVLLRQYVPSFDLAAPIAAAIIFGLRAYVIHRGLEIPSWLTYREEERRQ